MRPTPGPTAQTFEEAGVEPIDFDNGCPAEPEEVADDVAQAVDQITPFERAFRKAVRDGTIEEGQNPSTYPPRLRELMDPGALPSP